MGGLSFMSGGWARSGSCLAILTVAVAGTGCRGDRPASVAYEGPFADEVRAAIPNIEQASGLRFKTPPIVEARTQAEVRAFLERSFAEQEETRNLDGQVRAYKRLGLFADTLDVRRLILDLLTEQIVGFYDPDTKVLYVVDGTRPELRETIIAHELVHALQDQYLNLDSLQNLPADNDRLAAIQAVIEGQAVYEQMQAMLGPGDVANRLPGGWDRIRQTIREQSTNMPLFSSAPIVLQETLIFPYLSGAEFVRRLKLDDSTAIPNMRLPASTEQVLHAGAYDEPDVPTTVELPPPAGGTAVYDNNLGEFETRLLLYQWLRDQSAAVRGAAGWDGDRYVLFTTPQGDAIAWLTVWDSPVDAGEFYDVMDLALRRRFTDLRAETVSAQERRYTGGGRALRLSAAEVQARPAVLFVDVPLGGRTDALIDLTQVRLREIPPGAFAAPPLADSAGQAR